MIVTNSIIKVKREFKSKDEIKNYLYSFIQNHPFRQYNQKIADEYGEDLFSMTFIPSDTVVLTQRYPTQELYYESLPYRNDIIRYMNQKDIIDFYKPSDPIRVET
tara:strand:+ start:1355 stop:1669 length:315 start_codon:yes stop_codon:yes gene_type:complete